MNNGSMVRKEDLAEWLDQMGKFGFDGFEVTLPTRSDFSLSQYRFEGQAVTRLSVDDEYVEITAGEKTKIDSPMAALKHQGFLRSFDLTEIATKLPAREGYEPNFRFTIDDSDGVKLYVEVGDARAFFKSVIIRDAFPDSIGVALQPKGSQVGWPKLKLGDLAAIFKGGSPDKKVAEQHGLHLK